MVIVDGDGSAGGCACDCTGGVSEFSSLEQAAKPSKIVDVAVLPGGSSIQWSHDGQALVYVKNEEGVSNIWSQPLSGGAARQLTDLKIEPIKVALIKGDKIIGGRKRA